MTTETKEIKELDLSKKEDLLTLASLVSDNKDGESDKSDELIEDEEGRSLEEILAYIKETMDAAYSGETKLVMGILLNDEIFIPILRDFENSGYISTQTLNRDIDQFNNSFTDKTIEAISLVIPKKGENFARIITSVKFKNCMVDGLEVKGFFIKSILRDEVIMRSIIERDKEEVPFNNTVELVPIESK